MTVPHKPHKPKTHRPEAPSSEAASSQGPSSEEPSRETSASEAPRTEAPAPEAPPADLAARLADAEKKASENWDRFLRARADLENYRRRVERDIAAMVRRGKRDLILRLLDVLDNLERAAAWEKTAGAGGVTGSGPPEADGSAAGGDRADDAPADGTTASGAAADATADGAALIYRQLLKILADEGVVPIEAEGRSFDPAVHEAIGTDSRDDLPPDTVTEVLQEGYTFEGEVLRPARVRVNQPPT